MNITASEVNKLRQTTGAGMMDCKKALVEAEGDFDKAVDILRKKGQKVAAKRSDRDASEGVVLAKTTADGKRGVLISLNCETDFVAKNQDFQDLAERIAQLAAEKNPNDLSELKSYTLNGDGQTVEEKVVEAVGKIGEKIELSAFEKVESENVVAYNHPGNKLAAIVGVNKPGESFTEVTKQLAMQVAAMAPVAIDKDGVPEDVIQRELEVGKDQAREEGKPEEMLEKIAQGKLNKFFKENTLLNQQFIKDNQKTVSQFLNEADQDLQVSGFRRIALG